VRFVMPIMAAVDCDNDEVRRVVILPEAIREGRDHMGHFLVYDEAFIRRHEDRGLKVAGVRLRGCASAR